MGGNVLIAALVIVGLSSLAVLDLGVVVAGMLAFAVTAAVFDPRSEKLATR